MRILFFLLSIAVAHAASLTGKVVGVTDGDTITVLTAAKESVKVRLHGIGAWQTEAKKRGPRALGGQSVSPTWEFRNSDLAKHDHEISNFDTSLCLRF
jgi:hypothetical protein